MLKLIKITLIILLFNSVAFADDSISKAIDRGISKTLTSIGEVITEAIPVRAILKLQFPSKKTMI